MGLLETMKQVAQATNDAGMPTAFLFGSVTKTSPLTIRVDNRFDISGDAIVVMKEFQAGFYPTHYHTGVKVALPPKKSQVEAATRPSRHIPTP